MNTSLSHLLRVALAAAGLCLLMPALAQEVDLEALNLVEAADRVRFPAEGFEVAVHITSKTGTRDPEEREYLVRSKGNENTLVITTAPASEKGQVMLMRDRDLWIYMPRLSQPVRLPLAQRLTGQVANGDLARANFTGDYNARRVREEVIERKTYVVLELTGIDGTVTYHRVLYWVEKGTGRPYKAEFYAVSGRLLKTCLYRNYKTVNGVTRPTQLVMTDAVKRGDESVMDYGDIRLRELPDKMFTKDYLKKLD